MYWFKSRTMPTRTARPARKLAIEQLESRFAAGVTWSLGPGINITGISMLGSGIVAAGSFVELSIAGTGEDWDPWMSDDPVSGGSATDTVVITWSGAPCQVLDNGKRALCQIGSAGSPGVFDILMGAEDGGILPAGDGGSRDDPAVNFGTSLTGVWVTISLASSGSLQGVYPDGGFMVSGFADNELGSAVTFGYGQAGLWSKVELTGHVAPQLASIQYGLGSFEWKQTDDERTCFLRKTGQVTGQGLFLDEEEESPEDRFQTHQTANWKVFMTDAPGRPEFSGKFHEEIITYSNFTNWVTFNGARASFDFKWHQTIRLINDGTDWMYNHPIVNVGVGHDQTAPTGTPPATSGPFAVNCSNQYWPPPAP